GFLLNYLDGRVGAMGKRTLIWDMRVFDEQDKELGSGQVGELVGRPTDPSLRFYEYYKNPKATEAKTRGGWLRTGDLAHYDEEGYFYFVDRKNDCMRRRGENISSYEIEKVVNKHPQVLESAAYGVPSELAEDDVMICVVPQPGESINPEDLVDYCAQNMSYYMVPRYIRFADELEKTGTQRVRKFKLKEEGVTPDTWDREKSGYELKKQF
ncbi:MAG: ATP-dependent acyl-CoA ligase, partial [Dehalococcoidia bacterium]